VWIEVWVVDGHLQAERMRMAQQPGEQLGCLIEVKTTRNWRVDGRHERGVEDVDIEGGPEAGGESPDSVECCLGCARDLLALDPRSRERSRMPLGASASQP
jgi:hypothetical protein